MAPESNFFNIHGSNTGAEKTIQDDPWIILNITYDFTYYHPKSSFIDGIYLAESAWGIFLYLYLTQYNKLAFLKNSYVLISDLS